MSESVQHYDAKTKTLEKPKSLKVRKFLANGCIRKVDEGHFECLPLLGYNKTTYNMTKIAGMWRCNCQGFGKNNRCSHLDALYIKLGNNNQMDIFQ